MNPRSISKTLLLLAFAGSAALGLVAWQDSTFARTTAPQRDTLPEGHKKIKDLDAALQELDRGLQQLDAERQKPLPPVPPLEPEKIKADIERSFNEVDFKKVEADLKAAMEKLETDLKKANAELADKGQPPLDAEKIKAGMQSSLAQIDVQKMQADLARVQQMDFKKMQQELDGIKPRIEQQLKEAKVSMEKAKADLQQYKSFVDGLDKDGLINKKGNYTIEIKDDQFSINGTVQPANVYTKYRSFLEQHKNISITQSEDGFNIRKK